MDCVWLRTRKLNPEVMNLIQAKGNKDPRAEWLSFGNINDWTNGAKTCLVDLDTVLDVPGVMCECVCTTILRFLLPCRSHVLHFRVASGRAV